jgi:hypothetical protein
MNSFSEQLKSHKSVEQIAKKHRMEVSFIQKQLDMGEPIEHEHTKDHTLAMDIALQHLDEIPDYYTRLKKMEASAKKEHKKFNDVKVNEDLRIWFSKDDPKGNWRRFNTKGEAIGPCAREPGEPKPKCLSNEKSQSMSKSQIAAAVKRKRREDPVADRPGKGGKPILSSNEDFQFQNVAEEKCGKGMYWCNTNKECKPLPTGFNVPGQKIKPTEVGIGKPVEGACNHTKKGKTCPTHGNEDCSMKESKDHEYSMARSELSTIMNAAKRLKAKMGKGEGNVEAWVQSKITKAADYLDSAADYVDSGEMDEAANPAQQAAIAINMKEKGIKRKLKEHKGIVSKILEQLEGEEELNYLEEKNKPTNPSLWSKAKSLAKQKFDVYPSAYANGWASKWYKSKGGGWESITEDVTIEDANGNTFAEVVDVIKPEPIKGFKQQVDEATRLPATTGNIISVMLNWRGKTYGTKMFFPQTKLPTRKDVEYEIQKVYPDCRILTYKVAEFVPGQALIYVDNTKSKNYLMNNKTIGEDWQSINRKDNTDGMSKAAVDEYRRENKGSNLQTAVTEKKPTGKRASRRKNFCSRMSGMKSKLTSAKTAKDPDSRINRALRRWNCR